MAQGTGIKVLKTLVRAPRANAIYERFIGSLKRECLDFILILSCAQLRRILHEYLEYYHHARPHQGLDQRRPDPYPLGDAFEGRGDLLRPLPCWVRPGR